VESVSVEAVLQQLLLQVSPPVHFLFLLLLQLLAVAVLQPLLQLFRLAQFVTEFSPHAYQGVLVLFC